ncbi:MAG: hypothetical protein PHU97_11980, partial [Bacteroidales bacterium]|nr:hypothetical protein [Bacteroidales bacterium]
HFFSALAANQLLQLHHLIENLAEKELYKETLQILAQKVKKAPPPDPVSSDDLEKIRKKLNPDARIKSTISYYVPEILHETIGPITQKAEETGLSIKNVGDISYGKKITFEFKHHVAEINLFYGKNGFKVVKSPKRGHYPPLAEVAFLLVHNAIAQMNFDPTPADEDLQNLLDLLA